MCDNCTCESECMCHDCWVRQSILAAKFSTEDQAEAERRANMVANALCEECPV